MAKQSKRQRKFQVTGGVKGRIEKGTVTKHGKLRKRRKTTDGDAPTGKAVLESSKQDRSDDLRSPENLGNMDIDSFFAKFDEGAQEEDVDSAASEEEESSHEGSGDDDDDDSVDEKAPAKTKADMPEKGNSGSDSGSDSDDDDLEAAESQMKAEMAKMQKSDPEFHEFLRENEESLLEFGEDEDEEEEPDEEEGHDKKATGIQLTPKVLASLAKGSFTSHGVKSLKKLVNAYKSACHMADAGDSKPTGGYIIESSKVFDELMVMCLQSIHKEFQYHLLGKDEDGEEGENEGDMEGKNNKPLNPKTLEKAERWADLKLIMMSFFKSTIHVMSEAKEPALLAFILKALSKYARYMTPFPRLAESMLKSLTSLWSAPLDSSEDYQVVRLNAFLRIRQLALTQPFPFIEDCLKKTYLAYAKRAKFGSSVTNSPALPTLTFMGNCLVELYSLDFHSAYQHAFVYIRQLALLLRTAMHKKTPEATQQVYCWQYVHCLKLWVAVLSSAAPQEDGALMRSLIYPLTEIILGTVRFVPSPVRHMPLRFHCIRLLQQLAASSEVFIPTTSLLVDVLDWKEWNMPTKKTKTAQATRGLQLHLMLKLGKEDTLRTHEQLDAGMSEFFVLLNREIELYRYSAGFPEFCVSVVVRLRHFAKEVRNPRWRACAKACIDTCNKNSTFAVQARSQLHEAPKDVKLLECLKPAGEKSMRERHSESVEKEQKVLDAARPLAPKNAKKDEDVVDSEEESDVEEEAKPKKKQKKRKDKSTKKVVNKEELERQMMADDELMEEADQVNEGIDWSDEE